MPIPDGIAFHPPFPNPGNPEVECVLRLGGASAVTLTWTEHPHTAGQRLLHNNYPAINIPTHATGVVFQFETVAGTNGGTVDLTASANGVEPVSQTLTIASTSALFAEDNDELIEDFVESKGIPISLSAPSASSDGVNSVDDTALISISVPTPSVALRAEFAAMPTTLIVTLNAGRLTPNGIRFDDNVLDPEARLQLPERIQNNRNSTTFPIRLNRNVAPGTYYAVVNVKAIRRTENGENSILIRFDKF